MHRQILLTAGMLAFSNLFMTFAWYGHLKTLGSKPLIFAILASWGIAFFEYLIMVPANRIGHSVLRFDQLKIMQELITLSIFVPFSILFLKEKVSMNYLYASFLMAGAAWLIFKK